MKNLFLFFVIAITIYSCQVEPAVSPTKLSEAETTEISYDEIQLSTEQLYEIFQKSSLSPILQIITPINSLKEFEDWLKLSDSLMVITFIAPWCGPCKMWQPIFEDVAELYKEDDNCLFGIVKDVDIATDLVSTLNIRSIPYTMLIKQYEAKMTFTGVMRELDFIGNIERYI